MRIPRPSRRRLLATAALLAAVALIDVLVVLAVLDVRGVKGTAAAPPLTIGPGAPAPFLDQPSATAGRLDTLSYAPDTTTSPPRVAFTTNPSTLPKTTTTTTPAAVPATAPLNEPPPTAVSWLLSGSCAHAVGSFACKVDVQASNGLGSAGFVTVYPAASQAACATTAPLVKSAVTISGACTSPLASSVTVVFALTPQSSHSPPLATSTLRWS